MSGEGPIEAAIGAIVNAGALAGAATLVWRGGKIIQTACVGWRDVEAKLPIERDTLFRIASMTKPITSTAALMLMEEGRFALNDPIARFAPEFSEMRVLRSPAGHGYGMGVAVVLEPDKAEPTLCGGVGAVGWPGAFGGW